jgi:hypothetical protein
LNIFYQSKKDKKRIKNKQATRHPKITTVVYQIIMIKFSQQARDLAKI